MIKNRFTFSIIYKFKQRNTAKSAVMMSAMMFVSLRCGSPLI